MRIPEFSATDSSHKLPLDCMRKIAWQGGSIGSRIHGVPPQGVALQLNFISIGKELVADGVGHCWLTKDFMPGGKGSQRDYYGGLHAPAIFQDFQETEAVLRFESSQPEIIEEL
jgi:hypothetical protein